jgi:hypothetical protein
MPEYRQARGRRHPRLARLLLVCVAMLCGARSQAAIADWGRFHGQPWLRRLGFTRRYGPSRATFSRLFRAVPQATVEGVLGRWAEQVLRRCPPASAQELEGIAVDGKRLRGSPVLAGRVVTADALLTQQEIARTILASRGESLLMVKANQGQWHADIVAAFAADADRVGRVGTACMVDVHGGHIEQRQLTATTALGGSSDWPGVQQALKLDRRVLHKATGQVRQ